MSIPIPSARPAATSIALVATLLGAFLFAGPVRGSEPVISEFMAANRDTLGLPDGSTPDWIEIHNPGPNPLDLAGWHLTDNSGDPDRWTFHSGATIAAGGYLIVYASGEGTGSPDGEYHANFQLDRDGEYLALIRPDGTIAQEFAPAYPRQYSDVSYGLPPGGGLPAYFTSPSPASANGAAVQGFVRDTTFSHKRGFYDQTFQLEVTTATPGATIYYTTNGTTPHADGPRVTAPDPNSPPILSLPISTSMIVRAYAAKPDHVPTNIDTQTYIFPAQAANARMSRTITRHPVWGPQMRDALLDIPSISLVVQETIPTEPIMSPPEIPASIEMIFPDGREGFQADVGIERFGGQFTVYPKHALRVSFKEKYGPKRLKFDLFSDTPYGGDTAVGSFDQILLRNGSHDSLFSPHYPHSRGTYIRNRYFFDRQIEMGHLSMRGKFVHVYLNGIYYGHFHLMERPNADFMATHLGGEEEDYDIMKGRSGIFVQQGNSAAWDHLVRNANNYDIVQDYMDVDNYIDYMLLNFYGGNDHDWFPGHNWVAGRKREPGGKFMFFMWDNDFLNRRGGSATTGSNANTIDNGGPGNMFPALRLHEEFRVRFADRVQKHFFNGGVLTRERVQSDFTELAASVSRSIIPETARWGTLSEVLYTPDSFQTYVDWIINVNAVTRSDTVLGQLRSTGLFPSTPAPRLSPFGGNLVSGQSVELTMPGSAAGQLYYTLDGSDPRLPGGAIHPKALPVDPGPIQLPGGRSLFKARSLTSGRWSPLIETEFLVGRLASPGDLLVTELNYRPASPTAEEFAAGFDSRSHFEFLELMNVSGETLQLANLRFVEGVDFDFAGATHTSLAPGERALVVYDRDAFLFRYPEVSPGSILGEYAPDKLNNDGEEILLVDSVGTVICQFTFNDAPPWPVAADGDGYTLVLADPTGAPDPRDPASWRRSVALGGSPGQGEAGSPFLEWMATHGGTDPAGLFGSSTLPNLLAYAVGADLAPTPMDALPAALVVEDGLSAYPALRFRVRQDAGNVAYAAEVSDDLSTWQRGETATLQVGDAQDNGDGTSSLTVRSLQPLSAKPDQFLRLRVTLTP